MAETFREALGQSESGGNYGVVNKEGYSGKYQWGPLRLQDYNEAMGTEYSMEDFINNPAVQEDAQAWHENDVMDYVLDKGLDYYLGKNVGGVTITPEAMIAMAHLGGRKGMRLFLESGGKYNPQDSNETSLLDYANKFSSGDSLEGGRLLGGDTPLSYGLDAPARDAVMTGFEMMTEGSPEYCPAGYVYDMVSKGCVPIEPLRSSPRPKARPELGAALQRFGLPSLA